MAVIYKASSIINLILHPIEAIKFLSGHRADLHEKVILKSAKRLLKEKFDSNLWQQALNEIKISDYVPANSSDSLAIGNTIDTMLGKWLYCSVRALQPKCIIETGISHGSSSLVILNALNKNEKGKLYSLDLPNKDTNSAYNFSKAEPDTGWLVPDKLKSKWITIFGDTKETLPKLLRDLKEIDYFFHDSDHSYEHMTFEFNAIYPFLKTGGVMSSDDINKNLSFQDFVAANSLDTILFTKGGSAIKS